MYHVTYKWNNSIQQEHYNIDSTIDRAKLCPSMSTRKKCWCCSLFFFFSSLANTLLIKEARDHFSTYSRSSAQNYSYLDGNAASTDGPDASTNIFVDEELLSNKNIVPEKRDIPTNIANNVSFCKANNSIPVDTVIAKTENNTRRFSIQKKNFQLMYPVPCGTSDDLIQAIAKSQRCWDDEVQNTNLTLLQKQEYSSTFIPHQCGIPYYTSDEVYEVLNCFLHVVIQGDSLSRHLQGGLLMALWGDLVKGLIHCFVSSKNWQLHLRCAVQWTLQMLPLRWSVQ